MLAEVKRFHRARPTPAAGARPATARRRSPWATFLAAGELLAATSPQHFLVPLVSAVWSCAPRTALAATRPASCSRSSTTTACSRVTRLAAAGAPWSAARAATWSARSKELHRDRRVARRCARVRRAGRRRGDPRRRRRRRARSTRVVVATHADAGARRCSPTRPPPSGRRSARSRYVGATRPCCTPTVRCCPTPAAAPGRRGTTCSTGCASDAGQVHVSYDMNRLQRLDEPRDYVVTLNPGGRVDDGRGARPHALHAPGVHRRSRSPRSDAARAQRRPDRVRRRVPRLGLPRGRLPRRVSAPPRRWGWSGETRAAVVPQPYDRRGAHAAPRRCAHGFAYRHRDCGWSTSTRCRRCRAWLRPFARFDARDHLGDPARERSAPTSTPTSARGRRPRRAAGCSMLANARSFGLRVQPADRVLVLRRATARSRASSPRCTTPTASGTATCCAPTPTAAPAPTRVLRLAVLRRRRALRDGVHRPGRATTAPRRRSRCAADGGTVFRAVARPGAAGHRGAVVPRAARCVTRCAGQRVIALIRSRGSGSGCAASPSSPGPRHRPRRECTA